MTRNVGNGGRRHGSRWRIAAWITATFIMLLPLTAMQFTNEVNWTVGDFIFAAVLLFGSLGAYEVAVRMTGNTAYRAAVGVALVAAFLLIWMNGAVGIIGAEDNPANLMYAGVLVLGFIGALIVHFRPRGMARALFATALAQALVPVIALITWKPPVTSVDEFLGVAGVFGLNGFFVALWVGSAWLFRKATTREHPSAGAESGG